MSGPATEKARLPNCVLFRLTAAARVVEERSIPMRHREFVDYHAEAEECHP